jgi:phosphoglycolate phosphatase
LGPEADDQSLVRKGLEFFLSYYREHKLDHTIVYPGVRDALASIQSSGNGVPRKLAVLSNKPVNPSRAIVASLGLGGYFTQVYGGNSFATKKPDPEGALKLVTEADVRPDQTAMVGDSHVDIRTGHNAALWTVAVKYGFAPHTLEVEAPDIEVDTPQELSKVFLSRT